MTKPEIFLSVAAAFAAALILRGLNVIAPLGIRNNNPGNLRPMTGGKKWDGEIESRNGYAVFSTALWGLRAMAKNIKSYGVKQGIHTISALAERWAPPSENTTGEYAATLAKVSGYGAGSFVDLSNPAVNIAIMRGIIVAENGYKFPGVHWFNDVDLKNAQALGGIG